MSNDHDPMHAETRQPGGIFAGPRKVWSPPRVILSELAQTEAKGDAAITPEFHTPGNFTQIPS